jgi:hypothetical protein
VELESGEYEINADDGKENKSIIFTINWSTNGFYFSIFRLSLWI